MPARERGKWSAEAIRRALKLYAVTDNAWLGERTLTECVEEALAGGTTFVQLRDKHASAEDLRAEAEELLALCRAAGVPFVVNDDVECALAVGADGVHVGQGQHGLRAGAQRARAEGSGPRRRAAGVSLVNGGWSRPAPWADERPGPTTWPSAASPRCRTAAEAAEVGGHRAPPPEEFRAIAATAGHPRCGHRRECRHDAAPVR